MSREISWSRLRANLAGVLYRVPGLAPVRERLRRGEGHEASARYCYAVWLRHLASLTGNGVEPPKLGAVMEVGPGKSLGVGLAALLSGAERYVAVDWVAHTDVAGNLRAFDELVALFDARASIPGDEGFPGRVAANGVRCSPERVRRIRESVRTAGAASALVTYVAPYRVADLPEENFADFVVSHAVMEHVDEAESLYAAIFRWLRPGGSASFVIDYRCHRLSSRWNGHWAYSDREWSRIRADRPFSLNRLPHSEHMRLLAKCGYRIDREQRQRTPSEIGRRELSPRFANLTPDDLDTSGSRILASRPGLEAAAVAGEGPRAPREPV